MNLSIIYNVLESFFSKIQNYVSRENNENI